MLVEFYKIEFYINMYKKNFIYLRKSIELSLIQNQLLKWFKTHHRSCYLDDKNTQKMLLYNL
jgi:hypothetical protein